MYVIGDYYLERLEGKCYLLPVGQGITDHRHPLRINETGAYLWERLCRLRCFEKKDAGNDESGDYADELANILMKDYGLDRSHFEVVFSDVSEFLGRLEKNGIIYEISPDGEASCFSFGALTVECFVPKELLHESLWDFRTSADDENRLLVQRWRVNPLQRLCAKTGTLLIHHPLLTVLECEEEYILLYPGNRHLKGCRLAKDGVEVVFYYDNSIVGEGIDELFYGFRNAFLYAASLKGLYAIHSASVLYKDSAILFSAPSGTGKSTHAAMWHRIFGAPYLNGDINLVGFEDGTPVVYGTPWCGTSGIYTKEMQPLGAVVLLRQSPDNSIDELLPDEKQLSVAQRIISHSWTKDMVRASVAFAGELAGKVPVFRLNCNREDEAALLARLMIG